MSLSNLEDSSSSFFQETTESSAPRTSETLDSAELSRPQEKDLANDEANAETNEANAETEEQQTEDQQPKEIQVVDLSEEQHDEGDHADAGTAEVQVEDSHVEADAAKQLQPQ